VASDRRVFAKLAGETGADGMAIDSEGRVYVTGNAGIHVLTPEGRELGLIPVPRRPVSLAFTGPGKKVLYAATFGATGEDGKDMKAPEGQRNNAMTLYKIDMLSEGFKGRPK
jgi:gluconolactonase